MNRPMVLQVQTDAIGPFVEYITISHTRKDGVIHQGVQTDVVIRPYLHTTFTAGDHITMIGSAPVNPGTAAVTVEGPTFKPGEPVSPYLHQEEWVQQA